MLNTQFQDNPIHLPYGNSCGKHENTYLANMYMHDVLSYSN